jgi:F420-0:gamma-glutamyl ligase-like protein
VTDSLQDVEALLRRYRKLPDECADNRDHKDVLDRAVGLLAAAGMLSEAGVDIATS